jgi:hypothetical protein
MRRVNTDPMRAVTTAVFHEGRVNLFFCHGRGIYGRWWDLTLECGHNVERGVRYEPGASNGRRGYARMHHQPPLTAALPAPKRVRCEVCGSGRSRGDTERVRL